MPPQMALTSEIQATELTTVVLDMCFLVFSEPCLIVEEPVTIAASEPTACWGVLLTGNNAGWVHYR